MAFVLLWARYFALTAAVELAVAVPLLGRERSLGRRGLTVLFAQLVTHPLVWFVLPNLGLPRLPFLVVAEGWAVGAESILYWLVFPELGGWRALGIAALANGASAGLGALLR